LYLNDKKLQNDGCQWPAAENPASEDAWQDLPLSIHNKLVKHK